MFQLNEVLVEVNVLFKRESALGQPSAEFFLEICRRSTRKEAVYEHGL